MVPGRCQLIVLKFYFKVYPVSVLLRLVSPVPVPKYSTLSIDKTYKTRNFELCL